MDKVLSNSEISIPVFASMNPSLRLETLQRAQAHPRAEPPARVSPALRAPTAALAIPVAPPPTAFSTRVLQYLQHVHVFITVWHSVLTVFVLTMALDVLVPYTKFRIPSIRELRYIRPRNLVNGTKLFAKDCCEECGAHGFDSVPGADSKNGLRPAVSKPLELSVQRNGGSGWDYNCYNGSVSPVFLFSIF